MAASPGGVAPGAVGAQQCVTPRETRTLLGMVIQHPTITPETRRTVASIVTAVRKCRVLGKLGTASISEALNAAPSAPARAPSGPVSPNPCPAAPPHASDAQSELASGSAEASNLCPASEFPVEAFRLDPSPIVGGSSMAMPANTMSSSVLGAACEDGPENCG